MIVIGLVATGGVSLVVAGAVFGGIVEVDMVPTYVLPGRCESVRNWV